MRIAQINYSILRSSAGDWLNMATLFILSSQTSIMPSASLPTLPYASLLDLVSPPTSSSLPNLASSPNPASPPNPASLTNPAALPNPDLSAILALSPTSGLPSTSTPIHALGQNPSELDANNPIVNNRDGSIPKFQPIPILIPILEFSCQPILIPIPILEFPNYF